MDVDRKVLMSFKKSLQGSITRDIVTVVVCGIPTWSFQHESYQQLVLPALVVGSD